MRVFMSYASEQKPIAEAIAFSLRNRGHLVFFDRDDLPEGASYDDKIATAIDRSDLFLFLISPEAVGEGRYTLTELKFARHKWRHPSGRVLPVIVAKTPMSAVPAYLKAVTILEPQGNIAAEVAFATEQLRGVERALNAALIAALSGALAAGVAGLMPVIGVEHSWLPLRRVLKDDFALENGVVVGLLMIGICWWLSDRKWWKLAIVGLSCIVGWIACFWAWGATQGFDPQIFKTIDNELFRVLEAVPEQKKLELKADIEKVQSFITSSKERSAYWSTAFIYSLCGVAFFQALFAGLAITNRAFRSLVRWIEGSFFATISGAVGPFLALLVLGPKMQLDEKVFWFIKSVDVLFALWYLPWLVVIPATIAFWLVRGQET